MQNVLGSLCMTLAGIFFVSGLAVLHGGKEP